MRPSAFALALSAVALAAAPGSARTVVVSNLGPGDTYDSLSSLTVAGPDVVDVDLAMPFTVTGGDYAFTSAGLAVFHDFGTAALDILLMADAGGLPGAVLETVTVTAGSPLLVVTSATNPVLQNGQTYWIGTAATGDFDGGWNLTSPNTIGPVAANFGGPWSVFTIDEVAFRVNGDPVITAVPEPTTVVLLGLGAVGLAAGRRRRAA